MCASYFILLKAEVVTLCEMGIIIPSYSLPLLRLQQFATSSWQFKHQKWLKWNDYYYYYYYYHYYYYYYYLPFWVYDHEVPPQWWHSIKKNMEFNDQSIRDYPGKVFGFMIFNKSNLKPNRSQNNSVHLLCFWCMLSEAKQAKHLVWLTHYAHSINVSCFHFHPRPMTSW